MDIVNFNVWKFHVLEYITKIVDITDSLEYYLEHELEKLYHDSYHPYIAAVIMVLKSDNFKEGNIKQSFVAPYEHKILIYCID